nr:ATP-binding cassette domain-containing protein [Candidatus Omnitrophota bacterium]
MLQDKSIISVRNLVKRFGDRAVLDGVTVDIPEGKITVIMGGSGCGKSTFLRHLIGLYQPDEGEILIDGQN